MFTSHAQTRSQQRNIPHFVVKMIMDYGNYGRHKGADVYFLDKKTRKTLRQNLGRQIYNNMKSFWDSYVVVSDDGDIITVAKRTKRLKFN